MCLEYKGNICARGINLGVVSTKVMFKTIKINTVTQGENVSKECSISGVFFLLTHVGLFATLRTVARQVPLSTGFSRQEYWSGLPFPSPEFREYILVKTVKQPPKTENYVTTLPSKE